MKNRSESIIQLNIVLSSQHLVAFIENVSAFCVCACGCIPGCVHKLVESRYLCWSSSVFTPVYFLGKILPGPGALTNRPVWLESELQGSWCLASCRNCRCALPLPFFLHSCWESSLTSSCFCGRHFAY